MASPFRLISRCEALRLAVVLTWFTGGFTETHTGQGLGYSAHLRSDGRLVTDAGGGNLLARRCLVLVDKIHSSVAAEFSQGWHGSHNGASPSSEQRPLPVRSPCCFQTSVSPQCFLRGMRVSCELSTSYITPLKHRRALPSLFLKTGAQMEKVVWSHQILEPSPIFGLPSLCWCQRNVKMMPLSIQCF